MILVKYSVIQFFPQLGPNMGRIMYGGSAKKRLTLKNGEDLLGKMWECLRSNNGIMVRWRPVGIGLGSGKTFSLQHFLDVPYYPKENTT